MWDVELPNCCCHCLQRCLSMASRESCNIEGLKGNISNTLQGTVLLKLHKDIEALVENPKSVLQQNLAALGTRTHKMS